MFFTPNTQNSATGSIPSIATQICNTMKVERDGKNTLKYFLQSSSEVTLVLARKSHVKKLSFSFHDSLKQRQRHQTLKLAVDSCVQ
jgi:hypothetical protein